MHCIFLNSVRISARNELFQKLYLMSTETTKLSINEGCSIISDNDYINEKKNNPYMFVILIYSLNDNMNLVFNTIL